MKILVIDYGIGNLASVDKALAFVGATPIRGAGPSCGGGPPALAGADAVVVPGVGHFSATATLNRDWRDALLDAIALGMPVLGICLGMQWLFEGSAEADDVPGLGVFEGRSVALSGDVKVPHVGWNTLDSTSPASILLDGIGTGDAAYFTHSYAAPITRDTVASTTHGGTFASVVERGRVFGAQWHPEKSGPVGLKLLANFVEFARKASPC